MAFVRERPSAQDGWFGIGVVHIKTTRKLAAQRQTDAAIAHLHEAELECAVTLAAAVEGLLPQCARLVLAARHAFIRSGVGLAAIQNAGAVEQALDANKVAVPTRTTNTGALARRVDVGTLYSPRPILG